MNSYKNTLKRRNVFMSLFALLSAGLGVLDVFFPQLTQSDTIGDFRFGLICGLVTGLTIFFLVMIIRNSSALKDEQKLREMYNREYDERMAAIRAKAGVPMVPALAIGMVIAGIAASFFNETVCFTLIAAAIAMLLVSCIAKIWYSKAV